MCDILNFHLQHFISQLLRSLFLRSFLFLSSSTVFSLHVSGSFDVFILRRFTQRSFWSLFLELSNLCRKPSRKFKQLQLFLYLKYSFSVFRFSFNKSVIQKPVMYFVNMVPNLSIKQKCYITQFHQKNSFPSLSNRLYTLDNFSILYMRSGYSTGTCFSILVFLCYA